MAIVTSAQPVPLVRNAAFALFCVVGGLWGAYDYWVAYPAIEATAARFEEAGKVVKDAEARAGTPLGPAETKAYEDAKATIAGITQTFNGPPPKLAAYDRPVQLWLWVVGCGILGTPFFIWPIVRQLRRTYRLDDQGNLQTPEGPVPESSVVGIDMSRWCSPTGNKRSTWKAWLLTADGGRVELDDHDYRNMHLIIGHYAHRFHPDEWTREAKRVKSDAPAGADATAESPAPAVPNEP